MKLIALMPARNEAWVIGASLRIAAMWNDEVIVLAHCCTDETADIVMDVAAENPGRIHLIVEDSPNWPEMNHRQRLLEEARRRQATHVSIVDADEILTGNLLPGVRNQIAQLPPGAYAHFGMPCMWRSLTERRVDPSVWADRYDICIAFGDRRDLGWQAAHDGYQHHHREPYNGHCSFVGHGMEGGVMHLQWVDWRRLVAKQTWYQVMETLKYPSKPLWEIAYNYSRAMDETGLKTQTVPEEWWKPYKDLLPMVDLKVPSWHERECERLIAEHGIDRFRGLNLANLELANAR